MRPLIAHCHLGLGTMYLKIGWRQQAHAELSTASEPFGAMEMTVWLTRAEAALAQGEWEYRMEVMEVKLRLAELLRVR